MRLCQILFYAIKDSERIFLVSIVWIIISIIMMIIALGNYNSIYFASRCEGNITINWDTLHRTRKMEGCSDYLVTVFLFDLLEPDIRAESPRTRRTSKIHY